AKPDFLHAAGYLLWAEINTCPKCLKHVGTAAATGGRTITMFGYRDTNSRSQDAGSSRDVKGTCRIATCAAGVHSLCRYPVWQVNLYSFVAHDACQSCDFFDTFAART